MNEHKHIDHKLAEALGSVLDSLTDEQKEKAKQCKTMEELEKFLGREGIALPDELLDDVAGGFDGWRFWDRAGNPFNIGDPYSWCLLSVSFNHDCAVDDCLIEIENGNYEEAKRFFEIYSSIYSSSSFDCVRKYLNDQSIKYGLGPLM